MHRILVFNIYYEGHYDSNVFTNSILLFDNISSDGVGKFTSHNVLPKSWTYKPRFINKLVEQDMNIEGLIDKIKWNLYLKKIQ